MHTVFASDDNYIHVIYYKFVMNRRLMYFGTLIYREVFQIKMFHSEKQRVRYYKNNTLRMHT